MRFDWLGEDGISVVIVHHHQVFTAAAGGDGETPSLVGGYFSVSSMVCRKAIWVGTQGSKVGGGSVVMTRSGKIGDVAGMGLVDRTFW